MSVTLKVLELGPQVAYTLNHKSLGVLECTGFWIPFFPGFPFFPGSFFPGFPFGPLSVIWIFGTDEQKDGLTKVFLEILADLKIVCWASNT